MYLDLSIEPSDSDLATIRKALSLYNLRQEPELAYLRQGDFLVVMRENGTIVAGTVCEFDWDWLYFDVVWTDEAVRGKGYGTLIMNAAENYAYQEGVQHSYLMTTSFQARPFYEKLGYERFAYLQDRPKGHDFHYMFKTELKPHYVDARISIEAPPSKASLSVLDNGLLAEIAKTVPLSNTPIAIFLRDEDHSVRGGLIGGSFWDWFDIRQLWVEESLRGQGWGKQILDLAEKEARKRDCLGMTCEVASFQALSFFEKNGFTRIGTLANHPPQHSSSFIEKRF